MDEPRLADLVGSDARNPQCLDRRLDEFLIDLVEINGLPGEWVLLVAERHDDEAFLHAQGDQSRVAIRRSWTKLANERLLHRSYPPRRDLDFQSARRPSSD